MRPFAKSKENNTKIQIGVRIPSRLKRQVTERCENNKVSLTEVVEHLLEDWMKKKNDKILIKIR